MKNDAAAPPRDKFTALAAQSPWDGWMNNDAVRLALAGLAPRHGGAFDVAANGCAMALFSDADSALRAALALQRSAAGARLRVALATGADAAEAARALLQRTAGGAVQLCAGTYHALAGSSAQLDACVVMAEYEADDLKEVALTLPPARGEELSTFSGLGMAAQGRTCAG